MNRNVWRFEGHPDGQPRFYLKLTPRQKSINRASLDLMRDHYKDHFDKQMGIVMPEEQFESSVWISYAVTCLTMVLHECDQNGVRKYDPFDLEALSVATDEHFDDESFDQWGVEAFRQIYGLTDEDQVAADVEGTDESKKKNS